jgi:two-component sensor histidine kinase
VSFMELQRGTPAGRRAAAFLDEVIGRVKGLALVHDVLGGAGFQAGQYEALLHRLAEHTLLQGPLAGRVAFAVEAQPLRLPSKALTALGIITNELFTNIAKHAFPDGRRGTVEVVVRPDGHEVEIRIRDDGVPPPARAVASGQLGLRLVRSLVEVSLQGRFHLETGERTTAIIRFPRPEDGPTGAQPPPTGPAREATFTSGQQAED